MFKGYLNKIHFFKPVTWFFLIQTEQKSNRAVVILLFVGVLMGALDISIAGPSLPSIEPFLKLDPRYAGWIFSIYVLFNLTGTAVIGLLFASGMGGAFGTIFRGISILSAMMLLLSLRLDGKVRVE